MTIIVSGTLHVDPAERDAFLAAPGCLDFSLSPDLLDDGIEVTAADVELHDISASEAP